MYRLVGIIEIMIMRNDFIIIFNFFLYWVWHQWFR